ncbi:putative disease resistance protein [Cinnamomum micranthum f. kanehirae]|uniref:Putative disease resistance protein n=1 Tax=Cinnamomum micranthum f. kanehirae TaxID=337451 RepID=A0A3S3RC80_9MAGN|nr:putative disease resistance protein [Cinnamomum micranthum f. kanehirae]
MDMIIRPVLEIAKLAWGPIGRRIGYIKNLKKNMKELDKHDLFAVRDDVLDKINSNKPNGVCNKWLENVKQIEDEVKGIREEFEGDKKCLIGWCPNIYSRMKLGKRVEDIIKEMTDQSKKRLEFDGKELPDAPLEKVLLQNVESNSLTATERTLKEILMFIEDENTKMIGVWGMGGVGKTTTMKLLNDRFEGSPAFAIVIWVTVSKAGNRRDVQNVIADRLNLSKLESDDQLKASVCKALRKKKFLLLLDDVWERIDLSDVGIPPLNQVDGCKVVLTTRSLKVCRQMKTNEDFKVETLSEDEAWNLFIRSAGDVAMTSDIKQFAEGIVKECGGLPLAINVVGSSLRNNGDVVVWRNTLRELWLPTTSENEDMQEQVFPCLRSSYDLLQDDCKKKLFLYCSLYPEDYEIFINDLVEYCWLEGYIHGVRSIEDARDKGHCMVIGLVDTALLERCRREGYVKMHDIVRDFALREAPGFLVKAELPSQVGALRQLKVLHLGGSTSIKYLPREVGELTRLKRLIVGFQNRICYQNDDEDTKEWNMKLRVPTGIIPKLQLLEELSLYVAVKTVSVEKEQWDDESMEVVVEELCGLEHLTFLDAYFPKVECLDHFLRHSKSVKATSSLFRRFRFRVGTEIRERQLLPREVQEGERRLVYNGGFGTSHAAIMETLASCSSFRLQDDCTTRKLSELGLANMNELKHCWVESCEKMETLFDGDEKQEACALLPNLEILQLRNLPELRSLCDGPLLLGSLSKLRLLNLYNCENLKKVFQLGIIRQLCSLETLWVQDCSNVEEIIEIEEEEEMSMSVASHTHNVISYNNDRLILHNIKDITLRDLPELVSICRGFSNFEWPSLETIEIHQCPKLKSLSFLSYGTNIVAPALKEIYCSESEWWEALEWEDNDIKQRLQPLFVDRKVLGDDEIVAACLALDHTSVETGLPEEMVTATFPFGLYIEIPKAISVPKISAPISSFLFIVCNFFISLLIKT